MKRDSSFQVCTQAKPVSYTLITHTHLLGNQPLPSARQAHCSISIPSPILNPASRPPPPPLVHEGFGKTEISMRCCPAITLRLKHVSNIHGEMRMDQCTYPQTDNEIGLLGCEHTTVPHNHLHCHSGHSASMRPRVFAFLMCTKGASEGCQGWEQKVGLIHTATVDFIYYGTGNGRNLSALCSTLLKYTFYLYASRIFFFLWQFK